VAKQYVVLLLELDKAVLRECGLTQKQFEELPEALARSLKKVAPKAINPTAVYFLSDRQKARVERVLEEHALDFKETVLSFDAPPAKKPQVCTVIRLDAYRRKRTKRAAASPAR